LNDSEHVPIHYENRYNQNRGYHYNSQNKYLSPIGGWILNGVRYYISNIHFQSPLNVINKSLYEVNIRYYFRWRTSKKQYLKKGIDNIILIFIKPLPCSTFPNLYK